MTLILGVLMIQEERPSSTYYKVGFVILTIISLVYVELLFILLNLYVKSNLIRVYILVIVGGM